MNREKQNGELKIDKDIPVPTGRTNSKGYTDTLRKLNVGDSVHLPNITIARATARAVYALGVGKYAARVENKGVRVWRIK